MQAQTGRPSRHTRLTFLSLLRGILINFPAHLLPRPGLPLPGKMLRGQCLQLLLHQMLQLRRDQLRGRLLCRRRSASLGIRATRGGYAFCRRMSGICQPGRLACSRLRRFRLCLGQHRRIRQLSLRLLQQIRLGKTPGEPRLLMRLVKHATL